MGVNINGNVNDIFSKISEHMERYEDDYTQISLNKNRMLWLREKEFNERNASRLVLSIFFMWLFGIFILVNEKENALPMSSSLVGTIYFLAICFRHFYIGGYIAGFKKWRKGYCLEILGSSSKEHYTWIYGVGNWGATLLLPTIMILHLLYITQKYVTAQIPLLPILYLILFFLPLIMYPVLRAKYYKTGKISSKDLKYNGVVEVVFQGGEKERIRIGNGCILVEKSDDVKNKGEENGDEKDGYVIRVYDERYWTVREFRMTKPVSNGTYNTKTDITELRISRVPINIDNINDYL